jgi:Escherichia/Staphylococcus phage prohead protease
MDRLTFAASGELEGDTLRGVAHVFGERTPLGGILQEFAPTAFDRSLRKANVYAFYAHDRTRPLAAKAAGTLRVGVTEGKLTYEMDLGGQSYAADLRENVKAGLMTSMSFGVFPGKWEMRKGPDGMPVRYHTVSDLFEISPVALPAFAGTDAQLHSVAAESNQSRLIRARARVAEAYR